MLRSGLLFLSDNRAARRLVMEAPLAKKLAERFVAGATLDEAILAARALNEAGLLVSLDHLGELVISHEEALSATDMALRSLERIASEGIQGNISLKPTQLGLAIEEEFCLQNVSRVLQRARELGDGAGEIFVRIDMEASSYTERTMRLVETLWARGYRNVGTVVQSYLRRAPEDLERLNRLGSRVRLVKGAYNEGPKVALPEKWQVDRAFRQQMQLLLRRGVYPAIATHDEAMIAATRSFAFEFGIPREAFEFQMLYGIRRDLQQRLQEEGYHVRVYLPYGSSWYPYLLRRVAERPANLFFLASNLARESSMMRLARPYAIGAGAVVGVMAARAWARRGR